MLAIPELAMPRSRKVMTICNGKREVWTDYEQAKAYEGVEASAKIPSGT